MYTSREIPSFYKSPLFSLGDQSEISVNEVYHHDDILTFILMVMGFNTNTVFAEQTDTINKTRIVSAPINKVWNIISDVDKNSNYWPIAGIKNINKTANTIEREVLTPPNNDNAHQFITLNHEKSVIENQTEGAITGIKTIVAGVFAVLTGILFGSGGKRHSGETKVEKEGRAPI